MLVVDELERLAGQFSFDNSRITTIKLKDEIIDKMEGHFNNTKAKLKPTEFSAYN